MTVRPRIVLTYLGPTLPRYVVQNLRYLRRTFAEYEIWLICDDITVASMAREQGALVWQFRDKSSVRERLVALVGFDPYFRGGFWVLSMLRLWAVREFGAEFADTPLVHLESDVWLAPNAPLELLVSYAKDLAFPLVDATTAAASLVVVRNAEVLATVLERSFLKRPRNSPLTDMTLLGEAAATDPTIVILPTAPDGHTCFHAGVTEHLRNRMSNGVSAIGGIVDAATWGQFLLGLDPQNARGRRELFVDLPHHALDCRNVQFHIGDDACLNIEGSFGSCSIFALHVHSKDARIFDNPVPLLRRRLMQAASGPRSEFVPSALIATLRGAAERRGLALGKLHSKSAPHQ